MCDLIAYTDYQSFNGYQAQANWSPQAFENSQSVKIGNQRPAFSWIISDVKKNVLQTAYRILLADNPDSINAGKGNIWDSEKMSSSQSTAVLYNGRTLKTGTVYYWTVKIWNNYKEESSYAGISAFYTEDHLETHHTSRYPLQKTDEHPVLLNNTGDTYFADFGKASFGQLKMTLERIGSDDTVVVHLGEMLDVKGRIERKPPGTIRYSKYKLALRPGTHTYQITIKPDQRNTGSAAIKMPGYIGEVTPFRYCEIEGYGPKLTADQITRASVHYPFDNAPAFTSSDSVLNKIWTLSAYSIKATSFAGVYVDGDRERIPYEADALINQLGHYSTDREFSLARYSHEYLINNPTWPTEWILQSVIMAWNDYLYTGDLRSAAYHYSDLKAKTLTALRQNNGLISTRVSKQSLGLLKSIHFSGDKLKDIVDWPQAGANGGESDGFVFTDYNAVVNAYHYKAILIMKDLAEQLGHQADVLQFAAQAKETKAAYQKHFWNEKQKAFADGIGTAHASLHTNMFAMAFGLVEEKNKPDVMAFIKSRGMACSVYGSQFLLDAVYDAGDADYGLELLTSQTDRSWYNMIRIGSTITLEAWDNKYKPNQDWNHAWGAAPANIIPRKLLGVEPLTPGWDTFSIRPQIGKLKFISMVIPTIKGSININCGQDDELFNMAVQIPANTTANVQLPLRKNAKYQLFIDNKPANALRKGNLLFIGKVGSGSHTYKISYNRP